MVRAGINRDTGERVAIKTIPKAKVSRPETLRREIEILKVRLVISCGVSPSSHTHASLTTLVGGSSEYY